MHRIPVLSAACFPCQNYSFSAYLEGLVLKGLSLVFHRGTSPNTGPIRFNLHRKLGQNSTTKARFGFQILLNYTGGALIFIRREQLCWKLKQEISRTHCPLHVRHVSFAPGMPARSESVTGCHGHFLIRQDLSKQMCLCLGGFSRSVMRNPKVDPD